MLRAGWSPVGSGHVEMAEQGLGGLACSGDRRHCRARKGRGLACKLLTPAGLRLWPGQTVTPILDASRRQLLSRSHSTVHLLMSAIRQQARQLHESWRCDRRQRIGYECGAPSQSPEVRAGTALGACNYRTNAGQIDRAEILEEWLKTDKANHRGDTAQVLQSGELTPSFDTGAEPQMRPYLASAPGKEVAHPSSRFVSSW